MPFTGQTILESEVIKSDGPTFYPASETPFFPTEQTVMLLFLGKPAANGAAPSVPTISCLKLNTLTKGLSVQTLGKFTYVSNNHIMISIALTRAPEKVFFVYTTPGATSVVAR